MKKTILFLVSVIFMMAGAVAQENPGCTDPQANNYNPLADYNDGSCTYNPTIYSPSLNYLLPGEVEETSGLIFWADALWTINDSGNDPVLFKLDTITGEVTQEITVANAENVDWEALAQDEEHIFIGDFGNNSGNRDDLGIYVVSKEDIPASGDGSVNASHLTFTYEDFTGKRIRREENNFDCEALISIGDSLYLFSKNWGDEQTKLYRLPKTVGDHTAELLTTFDVAGLVTGADYNAESKEVTLIGYTNNTFVPFFWLLFDYHENRLFSGNKRRIDLLNIVATQTEAISYVNGKLGKLSSEGTALFTQSAYGFSTSAWTDTLQTAVLLTAASEYDFLLKPNPVDGNHITLVADQLPSGEYSVELFDTMGRVVQIKDYRVITDKRSVEIRLGIDMLDSGVYFVRMRSGSTILEKKFIRY